MNIKKRILVCGGREYGTRITEDGYSAPNYKEIELLNSSLDSLLATYKDIVIIHGCARGADSLAAAWATKNSIEQLKFPAQWSKYGKAAGFLRNTEMLEVGKPDLVVAFPGGTGTQMMCKIASAANVEVIKIK
jgi:hypothetical protein